MSAFFMIILSCRYSPAPIRKTIIIVNSGIKNTFSSVKDARTLAPGLLNCFFVATLLCITIPSRLLPERQTE